MRPSGSVAEASWPAPTSSRSGRNARSAGSTTRVERVRVAVVAGARGQRDVDVAPRRRVLEPARVRGVEAVLVQRDRQHRRVVEEDLLGPVAVVHVPVDDRHALEPALALRPARRDAVLLKRQKPIAASRSAWWPGGRSSANALSTVAVEHGVDGARAARPRPAASRRACPGRSRRRAPSSTGSGRAAASSTRATCASRVRERAARPRSPCAPRARSPSRARRSPPARSASGSAAPAARTPRPSPTPAASRRRRRRAG